MIRFLLIFPALFYTTNILSQNTPFDSAVRSLYFDINVYKASASLIDTFSNVVSLKHNDTVMRQWDLHTSIIMKTKEDAWSSRHIFSFTKSPVLGIKIQSGKIIVTIGETAKIKQLMGVQWQVSFETKSDGELCYNKLKEIFASISTKQKIEDYKSAGLSAQYSTRKENENGIRDISFYFFKVKQTDKYEIILSLSNEFANE